MVIALGLVALFWAGVGLLAWPYVNPFHDDSPPQNPCEAVGSERLQGFFPGAKVKTGELGASSSAFEQSCDLELVDSSRKALISIYVQRPRATNAEGVAREWFDNHACEFSATNARILGKIDTEGIGDESCGVLEGDSDFYDYQVRIAVLVGRDIIRISYSDEPIERAEVRMRGLELARVVASAMQE